MTSVRPGPPRIGVFSLQGDTREHLRVLAGLGAQPVPVRRLSELDTVAGLVIPGGESTTMHKLSVAFGLFEPIKERIAAGMPVFGTCAGMIMLASTIVGAASGQEPFGGIDMTVRRNAFGRQVDSFEADVDFDPFDTPVRAVFIRAPWVEAVGERTDVLARVSTGPAAGRIVAVQQGHLLATSFHPEITGDIRVHSLFVDLVRSAG